MRAPLEGLAQATRHLTSLFLVDRMPLQPILAALPPELGEFLDLAALRSQWQRGEAHSTLWFAVSVALGSRSIYG